MISVDLGKYEAHAIIGRGSHAPDQEGALSDKIIREEVHHRIEHHLHQGDHGQHHPVPEPDEVVLHVLREYRLDGPVDRVEEAQSGPEYLPPLSPHCRHTACSISPVCSVQLRLRMGYNLCKSWLLTSTVFAYIPSPPLTFTLTFLREFLNNNQSQEYGACAREFYAVKYIRTHSDRHLTVWKWADEIVLS